MKPRTFTAVIAACATLAVALYACSPAPRHTLNADEKTADMYWLYSQFGENYAPLEYKETRNGFHFADLKADFLKRAGETTTNSEFYRVMFEFVSSFKDAHTAPALSNSDLPGRTLVAYLGFSGNRIGDALEVTSLLPTIDKDSAYPIQKGDKILKLDGMTLKNYVLNEMVKYRNLGQDESNLTMQMNKIFNRVETANGLPAKTNADLTIDRGGKELAITLPWIVKDLVTFTKEQAAATKGTSDSATPRAALFQAGILALGNGSLDNNSMDLLPAIFKTIDRKAPGFKFVNTFAFVDPAPELDSEMLRKTLGLAAATPRDELKEKRTIPSNVLFVEEAKTFPTYIRLEDVKNADGKATGATKFVGYMYLNTFSPSGDSDSVVKEFTATVKTLQKNGARDLVIDMINNGGGSLELGLKMAQLLSRDKITAPEMQFRLSETWLDEFEKESINGSSDAERELARRVFAALKEDSTKGQRLSRRMSTESLMPFALTGNDAVEKPFNIVLLVNEMCASMCDIFTATLKDNGMARVMGSKTMGAGGNVVNHYEAPNSHLTVRQTESLMLRKDGSYIENNGIDPDFDVNVNLTTKKKYEPIREKAFDLLTTESK